jgi:hypothetical protein
MQLVRGTQERGIERVPAGSVGPVGDANDLFIGEAAGFGDDRVLAPLVLGPASPSRPKDEDLAISRRKSRLEENVVAEDEPPLEQFRMIDERPEDVVGGTDGYTSKQLA